MHLPKPFDTFRLEKRAGERKEFKSEGYYSLAGVTYPTDYGDIQGYVGEDGLPLDVFVGTGELFGYIQVYRPELPQHMEHKFLVSMTPDEEAAVLSAFEPVLRGYGRFETVEDLLYAIEPFRNGD